MIVDNFNKFPREFRQWEFYFIQVIDIHKNNPTLLYYNITNE